MNTADGTDRKEKKIDKKDGYNIVLGYFPMSGGEKNTFCIIKYVVFFGFFTFFNVTFFSFLQKIIL